LFHRIRASVIIPDVERVLLVKHFAPRERPAVGGMTGRYWSFPGGRLESDESVLERAVREAREETGLEIVAERVVYIHEVINRLSCPGQVERPIRQVELYVLASSFRGPLALDEADVLDARFFARDQVAAQSNPPMLYGLFWDDLERGSPETRFLGTHYVG
jgi:ADP-ribose pyrophosphatase YjhB (NUDIX family)